MEILRGSVFMADLGSRVGSEQFGRRPVVVIQNDYGNRFSNTIIVAPLTRAKKKRLPTYVYLDSGSVKGSTVLCEQIITIDKSRLDFFVYQLGDWDMIEIDRALLISLNLVGV